MTWVRIGVLVIPPVNLYPRYCWAMAEHGKAREDRRIGQMVRSLAEMLNGPDDVIYETVDIRVGDWRRGEKRRVYIFVEMEEPDVSDYPR